MSAGVGNALLLAAIAVVPLVLLMLTSFVKLSVVLSLVRNAIGAPDAPSGLVVMGLSLVLTFFVMSPVVIDMATVAAHAHGPAPATSPGAPPATLSGAATTTDGGPSAIETALRDLVPVQYQPEVDGLMRAAAPLRGFLAKHASPADRDTFLALAKRLGHDVRGDELWVLAPAFITTELREAFAIAIVIFIPFLVIDLVVGLGLATLGLQTTSPQTVALPLKLLLFVAVDGWRLLIDALLRGYA